MKNPFFHLPGTFYPVALRQLTMPCELTGAQTNLLCRSKEDEILHPVCPTALFVHYRSHGVDQAILDTLAPLLGELAPANEGDPRLSEIDGQFQLTPPTSNPPERDRTSEVVREIQQSLAQFPPKFAVGERVTFQPDKTKPSVPGVVLGVSCDLESADSWGYLVAIIYGEDSHDEVWVDPGDLEPVNQVRPLQFSPEFWNLLLEAQAKLSSIDKILDTQDGATNVQQMQRSYYASRVDLLKELLEVRATNNGGQG